MTSERIAELRRYATEPNSMGTCCAICQHRLALTGMLANNNRNGNAAGYANDSYIYADAMLEERERK